MCNFKERWENKEQLRGRKELKFIEHIMRKVGFRYPQAREKQRVTYIKSICDLLANKDQNNHCVDLQRINFG